VDDKVDSLHVKRIDIENLVCYVYIVRVDFDYILTSMICFSCILVVVAPTINYFLTRCHPLPYPG
jgi:hypothetical protein